MQQRGLRTGVWVVLLVIGLAAAGHAAQPSGERTWRKRAGPRFRAGEVVVKFKAGVGQQTKAAVRRRHGLAHVSTSRHAGFERASVAKGRSVAQAAAALSGEATVEYAEPNYVSQAHAVPDDPLYSFQWHLDDPANPYGGANGGGINLEAAWDAQATQGGGVVVAVVDTGVAYENYGPYVQAPDLAQTTFVPGYDFVNGDAHPNDDESHGTHVAGTIAQSTNNGVGVAGVAFDCAIMPVKVLDSTGSGWHSDIADGIAWATDNGADVINMSLGGPASLTLENAVAYAYNNGVTVVCSAGNSGRKGVEYPAAYDAYCIAVAATRYDEKYSWYSSRGPSVDVAAPGGELSDKTGRKTTDQNGDGYGDGVLQCTFNPNTGDVADFGYWFFQGTSMAAPHVSGVAALVIAAGASGPDEVRYAIESTAEDKGEAGLDDLYGYGIVDAAAAVASVTPPGPPNEPPVVAVTGPADGSAFGSGVSVSFAGTASDAEDGDISAGLVWDSDLDGQLGQGAGISAALSDGIHTVTASATDSGGATGSRSIRVIVGATATASPDPIDWDLLNQRWSDIAGNPYDFADPTVSSYLYPEGAVTLDYFGVASTLTGVLRGSGLKPNFAYEIKLNGKPTYWWGVDGDDVANERLGYAGRWWLKQVELASGDVAWQGNSSDAEYESWKAQGFDDGTYAYVFEGYLLFDYVVSDADGAFVEAVELDTSLHVLWKVSQEWHPRGANDTEPVEFPITVDTLSDWYAAADEPFQRDPEWIYGEWEPGRPLPGELVLSPGTYNVRLFLTEESFHEADGEWATMLADDQLVFTIPNEPPVANDDAYGVDADDALTVSAPGVLDNDVDANGDALTAVLVTDVSHGVLTLGPDGSFSYAPDAGYVGDDSFTYVANDGIDDSTLAATVTITVNDVPDIVLTAVGRKVRGRLYADLEWAGAAAVNVYRDGEAVPAGAGVTGGSYTDDTGVNGGGTFVYQVREVVGGAETGSVSNEATVSF